MIIKKKKGCPFRHPFPFGIFGNKLGQLKKYDFK